MSATPGRYDVVVVGAGPAGAACALRSARAGWGVALLERTTFDRPRVGETLAPSAAELLRDLGVWTEVLHLGPLPSWETRSAWGSPDAAVHHHLLGPYGSAWHVERQAFDALLTACAARAGVALRTGTSVRSCRWDGDRWRVGTADGQLTARVLVDATGRGARVGRLLGAERVALDRLVAVAGTVDLPDLDGEVYLLVEAAEDGWWYSAPVPSGSLVLMLMTDADLCRTGRLPDRTAWQSRMPPLTAARTRGRRGPRPRVYAATSQRLVRHGLLPWLAVGDSALAVDPATGTGVVRALRTAAASSAAIDSYLAGDGTAALRRYEHDRDVECTAYLTRRAEVYGAETRWATPFWQRRTGRSRTGADRSAQPTPHPVDA